MVVLGDVVPEPSCGPVPEHGPKQGRGVDAESERSQYDNDVVTGGNGKHINIPPDGIQSCRFVMEPKGNVIVYEQEPEIVNGGKNHFVPLHPQVPYLVE